MIRPNDTLNGELGLQIGAGRVILTPTGKVSKSKRAQAKDLRREMPILKAIHSASMLLPDVRLERFSPGAIKRGKQWVTPVPEGWPDLAGVCDGRLLMIEVKAWDGRVRPAQVEVLNLFRRRGAYVAVCRSVDDFREAVRCCRDGLAAPEVVA